MTESFDSCPARRVTSVPPVRRATTHPGVTMQYETNSGFSATAQRVAARSACPARLQRPQSPLRKCPSRPVHFLKLATTLDGKLATRSGESKWITGETARNYGHLLRA